MKDAIFTGAGTAIVTPFAGSGVDYAAFRRLIDFQYEGGVSAIVVCGTTGEASTLSEYEHEKLYEICTEHTDGRMRVICGVGSNDTERALKHARYAQEVGADAILMLTPYYNKTTQEGLLKHFFHVADKVDVPMILYNVPSRTGMGIQPDTYVRLAEHPRIQGVKEASGNVAEFARVQALCGEKLTFWSGNDADTVAMMALGARGVISVASNLVPDAVAALCTLCLAGDFERAAALNRRYAELFHALFLEVNPIPVKTAMGLLGLCSRQLRLPLCAMSEAGEAKLRACLESLIVM